ncbi:hypothetical protein GZH49_06335 [Nocardia terpenica]|uniref:hypothetical protein n=1 Tax=Nocardia terpenica TaxID=455432 RepID=UPI002FE15C45
MGTLLERAQNPDDARTARALELTQFVVSEAVEGYLEAKLWTQYDELFPDADNDLPEDIEGIDRSEHCERLDGFYSVDDIDPRYIAEVRNEIVDFVTAHPLAVRLYLQKRTSGDFAHDFLLNRDGNGTGFWDRGLGTLGCCLSKWAEVYGASDDLWDGALSDDPNFEPGRLYGA